MSDFLVYWKTFWDCGPLDARDHVIRKGYKSEARDFAVGDTLWVVTTDANRHDQWKLVQKVRVVRAKRGRALADPDLSEFFDPTSQHEFSRTLRKLEFASHKAITKSGASIGLQLRLPRRLSDSDVFVLGRRQAKSARLKTTKENLPILNFPDAVQRKKVELAAIAEAFRVLKGLGYIIEDLQAKNLGYDLKATRSKSPRELHVEVKGTSLQTSGFYISFNEKGYMGDSRWRLLLVTDALSKPKPMLMSRSEVESRFKFVPIAWKVQQNGA